MYDKNTHLLEILHRKLFIFTIESFRFKKYDFSLCWIVILALIISLIIHNKCLKMLFKHKLYIFILHYFLPLLLTIILYIHVSTPFDDTFITFKDI